MDDETAEIQRRIAEARGVQERLTQLQARIRQQHDELDDAIREVSEGRSKTPDELTDSLTKIRPMRPRYSG